MTLQLHKATRVLTGKLRTRSWQKVLLLLDTEGNLTFPVLMQTFSGRRSDARVIKNTKMLLRVMTIFIFDDNSQYRLLTRYY